jgi:hypothetical protein
MRKRERLFASIFLTLPLISDAQKPCKHASRLDGVHISPFSRFPNQGKQIAKNESHNHSKNSIKTSENIAENTPRKWNQKMIIFGASGVPKMSPQIIKM